MNYIKTNPHPNKIKCGDCATRAVTIGLNIDYVEALKKLSETGIQILQPYNFSHAVMDIVIQKQSKTHPAIKGQPRLKVTDFNEGTYILQIANHYTCVKNGVLLDMWDCRDKAVYRSWKIA